MIFNSTKKKEKSSPTLHRHLNTTPSQKQRNITLQELMFG